MVRGNRQKIPSVETKVLNPVHVYRGVTEEGCLTCSIDVMLGVYLWIKHGSGLNFRNIEWKITRDQRINWHPINRKENN